MADYQDILGRAKLVRDATSVGENTATRVGGVLVDIVDWIEELKGSIGTGSGDDDGGGISQSELQAAIKNAMKSYSWWGRKFGDGTAISGNIEGVNSISFRNTAATITKLLSLDANGNLCFDGNFYATGGITALGQSSISGGGTSGGANLAIVKTVGSTATTLTTAAKKLNFIYPDTWGNIIQNAGDDEVNIHLDLLPTSGGASSGTLPYSFYVKCNGVNVGSDGFNGSSGMAINLIAGDGIYISGSDTTWGNKNITISASGSSYGSGSIQVATLPDSSSGSENWISGSKFRIYQNGSKLKIAENSAKECVDIVLPESSSSGSTSGNVQLNNMLFFYGSSTAGGTPTVMGGYDNSTKTYLKFQGSGVTVSTGTTTSYGDTTIVNITGGSSSSSVSWSDITGKPSTFAPSSHTHSTSDINNFTSAVQAVKVSSASKADTLATARTIWGQSFNGSANVTGALSSVTDVNLTGSVKWTSGSTYHDGWIELYASTPYIDFHYNKSASDFTARLIADGENLLSFLTNSGSGIFDIQNNKLKIGNGYLVWDDTNKAFRMTSSNGGNCNFYCDGGITALGVQSTTTSGSDFSFRNVTVSKNLYIGGSKTYFSISEDGVCLHSNDGDFYFADGSPDYSIDQDGSGHFYNLSTDGEVNIAGVQNLKITPHTTYFVISFEYGGKTYTFAPSQSDINVS